MADVLMDGISYGLKNNDKYEILINDRQFKETLKKEWKKGNISDDRIIALAQNAGADYLCFTKIKSVKGLKGKQVTAQVYNLNTMSNTGEMGMKTIKDNFSDLEDLTKIILNVVDDMLGTAKSNSDKGENSKSFTDSRDGKQYKIVTIGKQTWMAENLNYNASGSKCYGNYESECQRYGRLYNWYTAKTACPSGWHLPSDAEWDALTVTVGGKETAGKFLKTTSGWNSGGNGTDKYGFTALPGGGGRSSNLGSKFLYIGDNGFWWSSSESRADFAAYCWGMSKDDDVSRDDYGKDFDLFSVRCVQD